MCDEGMEAELELLDLSCVSGFIDMLAVLPRTNLASKDEHYIAAFGLRHGCLVSENVDVQLGAIVFGGGIGELKLTFPVYAHVSQRTYIVV